jgi:hypothetical protein
MKCRLLYAKTISDPSREDNGTVLPAGSIIEHPDAFWLCHIYQQFLRKLNDETFDLLQMDGNRHPLKYEAEPADLECLDECKRRGWYPDDAKLKVESPAAVPETVIETPVDPDASQPE